MGPQDDSTLVEEILAGNTARFGDVVRRHDAAVRRVVTRRLADPDAVEEVVQQTFYLAFRRLDQLDRPGKLRGWLTAIARHCVVDFLRREERRSEAVELNRIEAVARDRSAEWIWTEVERLGAIHREVLGLRYRSGLSYEEIAAELGVPVSTVRGRVYEARKQLRERLLGE